MANGDTTPSRAGQINSTGAVDALFLKKFAGEILTTFESNNVFKALHTVRTIESGKSASFPVTGIATASYHTPGANIADASNSYLSDPKKNEKIITIDDVLLASTFLANIDDVKNHYDIRSVYSSEMGRALSKRFDIALAKVFIAAARLTTPGVTGGAVGAQVDIPNNDLSAPGTPGTKIAFSGADLTAALFTAAAALDNNDVPSDGRFCVLNPTDYYRLITGASGALSVSTSASNKDVGGSGSLASGTIPQIAGIDIHKSTNIPSTDLTSATGTNSGDADGSNDVFAATDGYDGNFENTVGIVAHSSAVGTVKLLDLATESEYQIERQGTLFVAKYAMGHGILRGECALELVA
jgi:hypothetical protein